MSQWRIYSRRGRALRHNSVEDNKWKLHKSYSQRESAEQAMKLLVSRFTFFDGFKRKQFRLVSPDDEPPRNR